MSKKREEELFRVLNTILDAITALNLRNWEVEVAAAVAADRGETSTQGASASSKGKHKVANPDWKDIPYNPSSYHSFVFSGRWFFFGVSHSSS
jgi:hypothetical protein